MKERFEIGFIFDNKKNYFVGNKIELQEDETINQSLISDKIAAFFDAKHINFPLKIRVSIEGDKFQPFGMDGHSKLLSDYLAEKFTADEIAALKNPQYFYEIKFDKPGGLVMPIVVDYIFEDGSKLSQKYPAEIWRLNDKEVTKILPSDKVLKEIIIDPQEKTADINTENNFWPRKEVKTKFQEFKEKQ